VTYEFLNVGGKKMSTSKGKGVAAHTIAEVLPPEQLRFMFLRPRPNQVIDFDPEGDTIPRLFDEFDRIAAATAGREVRGELPADYERLFAYSLLGPSPDVAAAATAFRPAFGHLALLLQLPGVDIAARMVAEKGAPLTDLEARVLRERVSAAGAWLESFAPERARLAIRRDAVPAEVAALDDAQRSYLAALATAAAAERPASGDAWQALIFRVATELELASGRAFAALYAAFLGRANGPRAGWLLAGLDAEFVAERLKAAAA
jgi:lysyl-tRNA synthetase class 1